MKSFIKVSLLYILLLPSTLLAYDDLIPKNKPVLNPLFREYVNSKFNVRLYQGFGVRNVAWDLDVSYQFRQLFSIGIGNGFHRNKYSIFSSSDKHKLKMWSYPLYLTGSFYLFGNSKRACYIYGKYGRSFGLHTKGVEPNRDFKAIIAEGGIGYEKINGKSNIYFELGQYYTTANGVFNSTYNSVINYNLQIYSIVGRIGFRI